ncbi:MAG: ATP-binding cassette domain-containing protein [Akkermansiaceae bacterium]
MEINDLCVDYDDFVAVGDLSLTMPRGEVMGWVGPNGVGKTSTFRVMTMLMDPTYCEDEALWNGHLVEAPDASSILE